MTDYGEKLYRNGTAPIFQWHIYVSDVIEFLMCYGDESIDLCITDPPYPTLEKHRAIGTTTRLTNAWFETLSFDRLNTVFAQVYRVLKRNAHFYCFADFETCHALIPILEAIGFKVWKSLVWDKNKIGMGYHYRAQHEYILFAEKGKRNLNNKSIGDVLRFDRLNPNKSYPTEKPVDLLSVLVKQSTNPGDIIIDPFMGSGSTGEAAIRNFRSFVGCDIKQDAVVAAAQRLKYNFAMFSPLYEHAITFDPLNKVVLPKASK